MSDEHEVYIEKARKTLDEAEYLLAGDYRNGAVNRAYYSMYYAAKSILSLKQIHPKTHKGVIRQFGLEFVKKGFVDALYSRSLIMVKERREEADYGLRQDFSNEEAEEIVKGAAEFLVKIENVIDQFETKNAH